MVFNFELFEVNEMEALSQLFFLFQYLLIFGKRIPRPQNLKSQVLQFLGDLGFSILPLLYLLLLDWLLRATICCLLGHFSLKFLEGSSNVIAFGLFLVKFVLQLKRHLVITILSLL